MLCPLCSHCSREADFSSPPVWTSARCARPSPCAACRWGECFLRCHPLAPGQPHFSSRRAVAPRGRTQPGRAEARSGTPAADSGSWVASAGGWFGGVELVRSTPLDAGTVSPGPRAVEVGRAKEAYPRTSSPAPPAARPSWPTACRRRRPPQPPRPPPAPPATPSWGSPAWAWRASTPSPWGTARPPCCDADLPRKHARQSPCTCHGLDYSPEQPNVFTVALSATSRALSHALRFQRRFFSRSIQAGALVKAFPIAYSYNRAALSKSTFVPVHSSLHRWWRRRSTHGSIKQRRFGQ
jgi:hypothetical protein